MRYSLIIPALAVFLASSIAKPQERAASISARIQALRAVPDNERPAVTTQIAKDIRSLPPSRAKLALADSLSRLVTEGDPGPATLQAVGDTLALALKETPIAAVGDKSSDPYMDLARLVRYEGVKEDWHDPRFSKALTTYEENDRDVEKADFTLKSIDGKKVTLSKLRGKVVLVNFWATWCPPCRKEMADLDLIYSRYQPQGFVVLSLSSEHESIIKKYIQTIAYRPPVLLDGGGRVTKQFHVDGLPHSYVFDREGKLVAEATDMRTQRQFLAMLAKAGLKPM